MNIFCLRNVFLVFSFVVSVESHFAVIGPRTVLYKSSYKCIFSSNYANNDEARVEIMLAGISSETEIDTFTYRLKQDAKPITVKFDLSRHIPVENFTLSAVLHTKDGVLHNQTVDIFVIPKRYSVFIQTNKPVYNPGDDVLYRIVVLDSDLKPYEIANDKLKHTIYDGLGNPLTEGKPVEAGKEPVFEPPNNEPTMTDEDFGFGESNEAIWNLNGRENVLVDKGKGKVTDGVYSYSYKLNDEAIEGAWLINVTIDNEYQFATIQPFQVKCHIPPRFEVFVDTKHYVNRNEGDILLEVFANYTFGKYVSGKAQIKASLFELKNPKKVQLEMTKHVNVEKKSSVTFNFENDLKLFESVHPFGVKFDIEFEEALTGQVGTASTMVKIYENNEFLIKIVRETEKFKLGSPYAFEVQVMHADGQPAETSSDSLNVTFNFTLFKNEIFSFENAEKKSLVNGKARFTLDIPENTTALAIKAKYFGNSANAKVLLHKPGLTEYMTIELVKEIGTKLSPKVGNDLEIKVNLSSGIHPRFLFYVIFGRHAIVEQNQIVTNIVDDSTTISINATEEMSPACNVIVYYFRPDGEIVFDQMKVKVKSSVSTMTSSQFRDENEAKMPGQSTKLFNKAAPESFFSLSVIDQSVSLLGHGNDIDIARVAEDIKLFDSSSYSPKEECGAFGVSNAIIITNAIIYERSCSFDEKFASDYYNEDDFGIEENLNGDNFEGISNGLETRKVFTETWIFKDFLIGNSGKFMLDTVVPDTITSFVISGFAVHPQHGLAIAAPKKITIFKEFFAKLYVPRSIRLAEILKVDVSVFNYLSAEKREIQATVVLDGQEEFEFVDADMKDCTFRPSGSIQSQSRTISVPYNNGASTYFLIRAKKVGLMKLSINATATASQASVKLERSVKVEREGYRDTGNVAHNIDRREIDKQRFSHNFFISFPPNCIGDSIQVSASVIGDLLGPALVNIHNLMRMPIGVTEEIFKSFIPNVFVMKYLKAIGQLTGNFKTDGEKYLAHGYQELLKRQNTDGSFSLWGENGARSVWLTAYVAKVLAHTKEFVFIKERHIVNALDFIKKQQDSTSGGFSDSSVHNYVYISKTGSQRGIPLTAFVAIAFLENPDFQRDFKSTIDKIMTYLQEKLAKMTDNLSLSMSAYAFALHGNAGDTRQIFGVLKDNSARGDSTMYWEHSSPSIQVEIAAYAVMAMVKINEAPEALPIVNWLKSQRQASGGFYGTTDTVIGVQALAMFAAAVYAPQKNLYVKLSYENRQTVEFNITEANALVLQSKGLKPDARQFELSATGQGFARFQLTYSCNVNVKDPEKSFEITAEPLTTENGKILHLKVCASFVPTEAQNQTGMTVIDLNLPEGYEYDPETENLVKKVGVKRVETAHQKTVINLYFNSMNSTNVCPEIRAFRKSVVQESRSSRVNINDYYNKNMRASAYYSIQTNRKCGF